MSDEQTGAFKGIEKLTPEVRDEIITNAQLRVDAVNADTARAISAAKQAQASQAVAEALAGAGKITHKQRIDIITRVRRSFGLSPFVE